MQWILYFQLFVQAPLYIICILKLFLKTGMLKMSYKSTAGKVRYALIFFALFLILFLDGFGQSLIFPILAKTLLSPDNYSLVGDINAHSRQALYGVIIGLFYFFMVMGTAILGDFSDRYGRKKGLIICIAGMILGNLLTVFAFMGNNVWLIILGRSIIGFTAGSQAIAQASIADFTPAKNQARNTGYVILAVTLGAILGPIYGQILSDHSISNLFNNQTPFIGVILFSILSMLILSTCYKDTYKPSNSSIKLVRFLDIFCDAWRHDKIRVLLISMGSIFGCWAVYYTYMSVYLVRTLNATGANISILMSMYGIGASIAMGFLSRIIEKHFTTKQAVIFGWTLFATASFFTQLSNSLHVDYFLAVFAGLGIGIGMLFTMKIFSLQVGPDKQGWIMGIFNATWVGIMGISAALMGYIGNIQITLPLIIGYILYLFGIFIFITKVSREFENGDHNCIRDI
ncbi:MAG: multidrug transporter [Gammaproteobacteria bacterium]|jgi:predicted MFS family arabinose efflux permease|nr:multidrug transporter [Gammaproteobacteria bacterium]